MSNSRNSQRYLKKPSELKRDQHQKLDSRFQDLQKHEDSDYGIANYERVTLKSSKDLQMDFLIQKETLISNFNKEDTICGK